MSIQKIQNAILRVGKWLTVATVAMWLLLFIDQSFELGASPLWHWPSVLAFFVIAGVVSGAIVWYGTRIFAHTAERWLNPEDLRRVGKPRGFDVYKHPTRGCKAVKIGFCWPACLLGPLWMLFCGLWEQGGIFLGVFLVFRVMDAAFPPFLILTIPATIFLAIAVFGLRGNRWRGTNLQARGYDLVATVPADSKDRAIVEARKNQAE